MDKIRRFAFLQPLTNWRKTVLRFPLSVACSVLLFLLLIVKNHGISPLFIALLVVGFFWFAVAKLIAESRGWTQASHLVFALPVFAALVAIFSLAPSWELAGYFIFPGLILLAMVAPFVNTRTDDDEPFWHYNRAIWTGAGAGIVASIVLFAGSSAILGSIEYLFQVKIPERAYIDMWIFAITLFFPLYTLTWVPAQGESGGSYEYPKSQRFLVNGVLAPLLLVYFVVLYAYAVRILIQRELPRGNLAYMITGFGGAGVLTFLAAWPQRLTAPPLTRVVLRHFFHALGLPVILLFFGIGVRVHDYGFTEQRYLIILSAVWLAAMTIVFVIWKVPPLKILPGLLALLLAVGSFGPWGGIAVSGRSQFHRLEALLAKNRLLVDGFPVKPENLPPFADQKDISSKIKYLFDTKRQGLLRPWFEKRGETVVPVGYDLTLKAMGLRYIYDSEQEKDFRPSYSFYKPPPTGEASDAVSGFDYFIQGTIFRGSYGSHYYHLEGRAAQPALALTLDGDVLNVRAEKLPTVRFDLQPIATAAVAGKIVTGAPVLQQEVPGLRVRLVVLELQVEKKGGGYGVSSLRFTLLLGFENR